MITLFIGIFIGFLIGCYVTYQYIKRQSYNLIKELENYYTNIYNNLELVSFSKRINKYVYFTFMEVDIVFHIEKKTLSVFQGEECLSTSTGIKKELIDNIIIYLENTWSKKYNQVITINGNIYSVDFIENEKSKLEIFEEELSIDDVLDKINEVGIDKLSKRELDILYQSK